MIKTTVLSIAAAAVIASTTGAFAHSTAGVERRIDRQAERIEAGRQRGDLTFREGRQLRRELRRVRRELRWAKEDGVVTGREVRAIRNMLNDTSRMIYAERHDTQRRWRFLPRVGR